jgi:RHS repeat-associated protein
LTSSSVGTETTTFEYWPTGLLEKVISPDGRFVSYQYDAAHRLTEVTDADGNRVAYTLDGAGNPIGEAVYDSLDTLVLSRTRAYDGFGRLEEVIGSSGQTVSYTYDGDGNVLTAIDPMGRLTSFGYDELDRLTATTDPLLQVTQFSYDADDNLLSVIDPRALATSYAYNGFGDNTQLTSPDTGVSTYSRDAAGNIDIATDARSKSGDYSHDPLGRVVEVDYSDQMIQFTYDQGSNGNGQLTHVADGSGSTAWTYDALGRPVLKEQTVDAIELDVGYAYDSAGRLASLTTPSGQVIAYSYSNGGISGITVNGAGLLGQVAYEPFGPTRGWQWGNGSTTVRQYDTDGQLTSLSSAGTSTYTYFPDGMIKSRTDDFPVNIPSISGSTTFAVSTSSNRLQSASGLLTRTYSYDAAGSTFSDGDRTFTYDDSGRMISSTSAGVTAAYAYNGLGERVKKSNSGGTVYFAYDEGGHLIGEYDAAGGLIQETVWFEDIPVATLRPDGSGGIDIYYVHTDHLNTPRRITRLADDVIVWRWDSDPFGTTPAIEDPDGDAQSLVYNLRFPGQYYDEETGLHYNYFRDYDPVTGRYVQSDPIGLEGGLNPYLYVGGNPLTYIDPYGLREVRGRGGNPANRAAGAGRSLPQGVVDAAAGFGDALSLGLTIGVREMMGTNDVVDFCSAEYWSGVGAGVAVHVVGFRTGGELRLGSNWRMAPWGNRTGNQYGRWPHYHRRGAPDVSGNTPPGQGIGRHRPWEPSRHDRQYRDRF